MSKTLIGSSSGLEKTSVNYFTHQVFCKLANNRAQLLTNAKPDSEGNEEIMEIPKRKAGQLIGKGGSNISEIRKESNARIQVYEIHRNTFSENKYKYENLI